MFAAAWNRLVAIYSQRLESALLIVVGYFIATTAYCSADCFIFECHGSLLSLYIPLLEVLTGNMRHMGSIVVKCLF